MTDVSIAPLSTAPAPPVRSGVGRSGAVRYAWRQLTSMRTAIVLLFLLALAAVPGTLLPQRGLSPGKVELYFQAHPSLAPWLNRLGLFDVFAAPWFFAIYILLFISLGGCLVPRIRLHARILRARPPAAPRNLRRLPEHTSWTAQLPPEAALGSAVALLRKRRFRVDQRLEATGAVSVAAEKGFLRESGNLLFHTALLALLIGVALGGLFGYKGTVLLVEGSGFSNTLSAYDTFNPGRMFDPRQLAPFTVTVPHFTATYHPNGTAASFNAALAYTTKPGAPPRTYDLRVNHPLNFDGVKLYLEGNGYAPTFLVRDATGAVVYDQATPFLPQQGSFDYGGVAKLPDARPAQLGFDGEFYPSFGFAPGGVPMSVAPGLANPVAELRVWRGDLGLDTGRPQSVYSLDYSRLKQVGALVLRPGQRARLPGGGSITFVGVKRWVDLQVTHDPGRLPVLGAAIAIVVGLILSLRVRRRRVWLRAAPDPAGPASGRTVVEVAGLARTDHDDFALEFAELVAALRPGGAVAAEEE